MMTKETKRGNHHGHVSEKGDLLQEEPPTGPSGNLPEEDIVTSGEDSSTRFIGPDKLSVG